MADKEHSQPLVVSAEELLQWKSDPVTKVVYQLLRQWKWSLQDQWSKKVFQKDDPQSTAEANAAAIAQIEVLDKLIELDAIELDEALKDYEQ